MSLCGTFTSLALNITLLGTPSVKLQSQTDVPSQTMCQEAEPENANAVVTLKDASGHVVLTQKVRIGDYDFYLTDHQRGGMPARDATILFNYPRTAETARAISVEVKMLTVPFRETTRMPASITTPTLHLSLL